MKKFFLIGMPASGKSRLGKHISNKLNLKFIDLDDEIENFLQMKIIDIFNEKGEVFFRKMETSILSEIIKKYDEFIMATGGGTPHFNNNISLINKSGISIFIDTDREILKERILRNDKRPIFKGVKSLDLKLSEMYLDRIESYSKSKYHLKKEFKEKVLSIINSYTKRKN